MRYRAKVKWHGSNVSSRTFDRRADAVAWQSEQRRRFEQLGEWIDPRRGRVPLSEVAEGWLKTRTALKRRTAESDAAAWRLYIEPRFGRRPVVNSFTPAEIREWTATLIGRGLAPATIAEPVDAAIAASTCGGGWPDYDESRSGCSTAARCRAPRGPRPGRRLRLRRWPRHVRALTPSSWTVLRLHWVAMGRTRRPSRR